MKQNFRKKSSYWQKPFFVIDAFCTHHSIFTPFLLFSFLKEVCVFNKICFQVVKYRKRSKFPVIVAWKHASNGGQFSKSMESWFRRTCSFSVEFKMKLLSKSVFLCYKPSKNQLKFHHKSCWNAERGINFCLPSRHLPPQS